MTGLTLVQQIDAIDFSDEAAEFFAGLSAIEMTHEFGAVLLVATALLLAREYPDDTPRENYELFSLGEEFTDLVFETRKRLRLGRCRPTLCVVGGRDVQSPLI